jgi:hypothetical protein
MQHNNAGAFTIQDEKCKTIFSRGHGAVVVLEITDIFLWL